MTVTCPACELEVEALVPDEYPEEVCEPCHRIAAIMEHDPQFLVDPKYKLNAGEDMTLWIRRMHGLLPS